MTKQTESDDLARRFLDLWQDQAQTMSMDLWQQTGFSKAFEDRSSMADAEDALADLTARWMVAWPVMMGAAVEAMEAAGRKRNEDDGSSHTPAAGSPAAAASSGDGLHDLDQLLLRLDAMERRLAELEARCAAQEGSRRR